MGEFDSDGRTHVGAIQFVGRNRILIADADDGRRAWLRSAIGDSFAVEELTSGHAVLGRLQADAPRILIVGPTLIDVPGDALLAAAAQHGLLRAHAGGPVVFLLGDSPAAMASVDESAISVFYRLTPALSQDRVLDLIGHAFTRGQPSASPRPVSEATAIRAQNVIRHAHRLAQQTNLAAAATAAIAAVVEIAGADRARCLYHDDDSGALWSESDDDVETSASTGLAGYVARAGAAIALERAASDPTFHAPVDDPQGRGDERIAMQPVLDHGQRVHAVLIAIRNADRAAFSRSELQALADLASSWSPYIHQLAVESERAAARAQDGGELFRQEAIDNLLRRGHRGDVVRIHPRWINSAFWVVLAAVLAVVSFAAVARVHEYSEGPSVVRVTGRTDLIAYDGGSVVSITVSAGQTVTANQVLLRLHDTEQANRMRGLEAELERKLVAYLQSPADPMVRESLAALVAQRESGKANLDARVIRAPHAGVVRDVLVRVGQRVEPGKVVASVGRRDVPEGLSVLAFLPGSDRPRLRAGQQLRMTLPGYRGATLRSTIRAISSDVIGAAEAKARYLGDRLADSVQLPGSVVVVEAQVPPTFEADGIRYDLHDGMVGRSEIQLESRTVLETAIPGLAE